MPQTNVLDLSHWNTVTDFAAVQAAGVWAIIHKFSQGTDYRDPAYAPRRDACRGLGIPFGRYHFGDNSDVTAQVDNFLADVGDDELLALDFEDNANASMSLDQAARFLGLVESKVGRSPALYTGNRLKDLLQGKPDDRFTRYRLWLAQYGPTAVLPPGFATYWLWQFTGSGACPGVQGDVDCNTASDGRDDFLAGWTGAPAPAPSPGAELVTMQLAIPQGSTLYVTLDGPVVVLGGQSA